MLTKAAVPVRPPTKHSEDVRFGGQMTKSGQSPSHPIPAAVQLSNSVLKAPEMKLTGLSFAFYTSINHAGNHYAIIES